MKIAIKNDNRGYATRACIKNPPRVISGRGENDLLIIQFLIEIIGF